MGDSLSRDQIQRAQDIEYETVEVPEWGGTVRVRGLTGAERDEYESTLIKEKKRGSGITMNLRHARARLVVMAAVDEADKPLFAEDDIAWLTRKSARALNRVAEKARELSGLTEEDEVELLGNSESGPSAAPTSSLPSPSE